MEHWRLNPLSKALMRNYFYLYP